MTNVFHQQPEFVPSEIKRNNPFYLADGMYTRYQHWYPDNQLKDKTVLDIGSHYGQAGAYVLSNEAKEYHGIEINDKFIDKSTSLLTKYYPDSMWSIEHISMEKFIETNTKKYDIVFVGRVIHAILNHGIDTLIYLASICNTIVIESSTPLNFAIFKFRDLLPEDRMDEINKFIEYDHEFIEYPPSTTGDFINTLYSLGFLKMLFKRLGFSCDLEPYESMKRIYPEEYGMGYLGIKGNMTKKFVVRFHRDSSLNVVPLSRVEFESNLGISNVEFR
jgi:hypothetical protein